MKHQSNFNLIQRLLFWWMIGFSSLLTFATTVDYSSGLKFDLDEETKTATVVGCISNSPKIIVPEEIVIDYKKYVVNSIGDEAFLRNYTLTSITLPNSITTIGEDAFYSCMDLISINIPNSVTTIGEYAFYNCISLNVIELPNSITEIKKSTFRKAGLISIKIPDSVVKIEKNSFAGCSGATEIEIPNSVSSIEESAFEGCSGVTELEIPNSVNTVGKYAFADCSSLKKLIIADGEKPILFYRYAFWCENLNEVYFGRNWNYEDRDYRSFYGSNVHTVVVGKNVTSIPDYACELWTNLNAIDIPNSVSEIGNYAFSKCYSLPLIDIPNSVITIGNMAFNYCMGGTRTSLEIPNSVLQIGDGAFSNCGLSTVIVADGEDRVSISSASFGSLYEIYLGREWHTSDYGLFTDVSNVIIGDLVKYIPDRSFKGSKSLKKIKLPNSLIQINSDAFYGCSSLTSIDIPNSVKSIWRSAFKGCSGLTSINIPTSLWLLEEGAFLDCTNIKDVYYGASYPLTSDEEDIFSVATYRTATLWVPEEAIELCKETKPWCNFLDIKPYNFTTGEKGIIVSENNDYELDSKISQEILNLDGTNISGSVDSLSPGIYLIRRGDKITKILVK